MNNNPNVNPVPEASTQINNTQPVIPVTPADTAEQQIVNHRNVEQQVNQQPSVQNTITEQNQANVNQEVQIQNELQSIPTVEQDKQSFINNVQSLNQEKKEEKKDGINFVFIIILFIVILVAIYFLFPILLDYI